jgi:hypothetical protein
MMELMDSNISRISFYPFSTSDRSQQYVAEFDGRHFEVSETVVQLISALQESETLADAAQRYRGTNGRQFFDKHKKDKRLFFCD